MAKDSNAPEGMDDNALFRLRDKTGAMPPDCNTGSTKRYDDQVPFDPRVEIGSPITNGGPC